MLLSCDLVPQLPDLCQQTCLLTVQSLPATGPVQGCATGGEGEEELFIHQFWRNCNRFTPSIFGMSHYYSAIYIIIHNVGFRYN